MKRRCPTSTTLYLSFASIRHILQLKTATNCNPPHSLLWALCPWRVPHRNLSLEAPCVPGRASHTCKRGQTSSKDARHGAVEAGCSGPTPLYLDVSSWHVSSWQIL